MKGSRDALIARPRSPLPSFRSHGRQNPPRPVRAPKLAVLQHRRRARPVRRPLSRAQWGGVLMSLTSTAHRSSKLLTRNTDLATARRATRGPWRSSAPTTLFPSPTPTTRRAACTRTSSSTPIERATGSASARSPPTRHGGCCPWSASCPRRNLAQRRTRRRARSLLATCASDEHFSTGWTDRSEPW